MLRLFPNAIKVRRWIELGRSTALAGIMVLMLASSVLAHQSASAATKLVINIPSYTLSVLAGDNVVKTYPVAVGKPSAPTPVGKFRIISKVVNPTWYPPDGSKPVPPGADNPLGRRWLGFLPNGYGIHGNNNASSIGKAVSLGCVRMHNADVEELFGCISLGTELQIRYETSDVVVDPTTGQTHLVFYPDIYNRGSTTVDSVREKLKAFGLADYFTRECIGAAIAGTRSAPVFVCLGMKVQAGKRELIIETVIENGETLVAARPVLEAFNLPVSWDPQRREVVSGPAVLPAYVKAGQSFVHLGDLEKQLGIRSHWYEPEQMLKLSVWLIRMEKLELAGGAWADEEGIWLPVASITQAWEEIAVATLPERAAVVDSQGTEWPGKLVGGELYVSAETLTEILPVNVIILSDKKQIEIVRTAQTPLNEQGLVPVDSHSDIYFQEQEFDPAKLN